jgi:hypothetical protein
MNYRESHLRREFGVGKRKFYKKNHMNEPLLYIVQPNFAVTLKEVQEDINEDVNDDKKENEKGEIERQEECVKDYEIFIPTEENTPKNVKEHFKKMSVVDKIHFLLSIPNQRPKVKCTVHSNDQRYDGFIDRFENGMVYMKNDHRENVVLKFEDIEAVLI